MRFAKLGVLVNKVLLFLITMYKFKIINCDEKLTITWNVSVMFPVMPVDLGNKSSKGFLKNKFNKEMCNMSGLAIFST